MQIEMIKGYWKNANKKEMFLLAISSILFVFCWSEVLLNLFRVLASEYQTPKDMYFYKASFFFLIFILLFRKADIFKPLSLSLPLCTVVGLRMYLKAMEGEYGPQYVTLIIYRTLSLLALALIIIDEVRNVIKKEKVIFARNFSVKIIITIAVFSLCTLLQPEKTNLILFPLVGLLFLGATEEEWNRQQVYIGISGFLSTAWFFIVSFRDAPDVYIASRYVGNFAYPFAGANVAMFGIVSVISLAYIFKAQLGKWTIPTGIIFSAPFIWMMIRIMSVTDVFAFAGMLLAFVFVLPIQKKKLWCGIIGGGVCLGIAVFCGLLVYVNYVGSDVWWDIIGKLSDKSPFLHSAQRVPYVLFSESSDYFEPRTIGSAVDSLLSGRLSIWVYGLANVGLSGGDLTVIEKKSGCIMGHPHNEYIAWLMRYGAIAGGMMIILFFTIMAVIIKRVRNDGKTYIFTFLWTVFCAFEFMAQYESWTHLLPFMLLVLWYPVLYFPSNLAKGKDRE